MSGGKECFQKLLICKTAENRRSLKRLNYLWTLQWNNCYADVECPKEKRPNRRDPKFYRAPSI